MNEVEQCCVIVWVVIVVIDISLNKHMFALVVLEYVYSSRVVRKCCEVLQQIIVFR